MNRRENKRDRTGDRQGDRQGERGQENVTDQSNVRPVASSNPHRQGVSSTEFLQNCTNNSRIVLPLALNQYTLERIVEW